MKTGQIIFQTQVIIRTKFSFEFKIPDNFKLATGYLVTTTNDQSECNGVLLGKISLMFNSEASNPVVRKAVYADKNSLKKRGYVYEPLLEPLEGGKYITGYYEDLNPADIEAYNLKIYINGKTDY